MKSNIKKNIKHVVVLMLENRSADNLVGWLYDDDCQPGYFLPEGSPETYNGLAGTDYSNPLDLNNPSDVIKASKGVDNFRVPNPDPNEDFKFMNRQLFGLDIDKSTPGWLPKKDATPGMIGFLDDYTTAKCSNTTIAPQLMGTYTNEDLSVLSSLARSYAVSDNYHASCPTQTWPNRAFMHAGTSLGRVNNFPYEPYDVPTIFNAFEECGHSWNVYKSSEILPSLTRIQMVQLWDPLLDGHFHHISKFIQDCRSGDLPAYSFLEPSFVVEKGASATSEHPPADVCAGEHYLQKIWQAISSSAAFSETLFIINFDEHGGCADHVPPNWTAISPDEDSSPGDLDFYFNRYGVRVPFIFVSPHVREKTVFRASIDPWSKKSVPYDHTSIIAMLLDWKEIDRNRLASKRVQCAEPNPFDELLKDDSREDSPVLTASCQYNKISFWRRLINFFRNLFGFCADSYSLSSLQKSIVAADAHYRTHRDSAGKVQFASKDQIDALLNEIKTEADMVAHFEALNH